MTEAQSAGAITNHTGPRATTVAGVTNATITGAPAAITTGSDHPINSTCRLRGPSRPACPRPTAPARRWQWAPRPRAQSARACVYRCLHVW